MRAVSDQLAKMNPTGGAAQLRQQLAAEAVPAATSPIDQQLAEGEAERARYAAQQAQQQQLEGEHGQLATIGTQFGRGFLDAVTAPAALLAAPIEGAGIAFDSPGLEKFGRQFGESASGQSAIDAAAFLFGGGGKAGLTTAERVDRDVTAQQKAWPMLSTVSHTAGLIAPAAIGGAAGATLKGTTLLANLALGAGEGASAGAQQAYEQNEALRDVVSSALVGGTLGAATAGLGEGLSGILNSRALKAAAREMGEDANLGAVGLERSQLAELAGDQAGALDSKASELATAIKDYRFTSGPLEGKSVVRALRTPGGLAPGIEQAANETQAALTSARQEVMAGAGNDAMFSQFDHGPGALDDAAEQILAANGGDVQGFQALRKNAQTFAELKSLVSNVEPKAAAPSLTDSLPAIAGVSKLLSGASPITAVAHSLLVTVGKKLVQQRAASTLATLANSMVLDTVGTALKEIVPTIATSAAGAAGAAGAREAVPPKKRAPALSPEEQQDRYRKQLDDVNDAVNNPDHVKRGEMLDKVSDFPTPFLIAAGADMSAKMAQLHADMPKPVPSIRGKAYETLSSQQVQLANAMYEATIKPMSVFSDFAAGNLDYDKVRYAWKQYPGLKSAAQAGLMDILQLHLDDKARATIPDTMLSQLDNLFQLGGKLQNSLDPAFAARMEQIMKPPPPQPKPQSSGPLNLPMSKPTFSERIAGAHR